jgi:hypothetical protein
MASEPQASARGQQSEPQAPAWGNPTPGRPSFTPSVKGHATGTRAVGASPRTIGAPGASPRTGPRCHRARARCSDPRRTPRRGFYPARRRDEGEFQGPFVIEGAESWHSVEYQWSEVWVRYSCSP